jgi:tetratricopeptide (TPR) repeat protein
VPSYKKSLVLCSLLLLLNGCGIKLLNDENKDISKTTFTEVKTKPYNLENQYIILALESENQKLYGDAISLYFKLFENTNNYEYLVKYLTLSTNIKDFASVKKYASKYLIENIKEEEIILRLYIYSLFKLNEKEESIIYGQKLINNYKNEINYQLLASIYLEDKEYLKAYELFDLSYKLTNSSNTLLTLTNIQFNNLFEKDKAIKKLENHIQMSGYDFNLSIQLLSFYEKENEKDKLIRVLKNMYFYYKNSDNQFLLNKTKVLFIKYVARDNINHAITFLEENKEEDENLLNLYKVTNQTQKANDLLDRLYIKTNNLDYLAQQAIFKFEMTSDKESILDEVISKFDKVLENSSNPIYENYLAYILIDFNIDIKRGLVLVKKALETEPNNIAYIDTLAWGEYKLKNCKEAYIQMKKVVDEVGMDDEEIKLHWEQIQECKE